MEIELESEITGSNNGRSALSRIALTESTIEIKNVESITHRRIWTHRCGPRPRHGYVCMIEKICLTKLVLKNYNYIIRFLPDCRTGWLQN